MRRIDQIAAYVAKSGGVLKKHGIPSQSFESMEWLLARVLELEAVVRANEWPEWPNTDYSGNQCPQCWGDAVHYPLCKVATALRNLEEE